MAADKSDAEILLNYPPLINGATQNVIPNPAVPPDEPVRGAPKVLFTPVLNQQGVLANAVTVLVDPPPRDGPGEDNIAIELLLNGQSLENRQIPAGDRDNRTEFNLFESLLIDGRNNRLEYKVHRPGGNVGDSTPLWVLYSAELPGGNVVPGDDDHPYLDISLPAELGDPPVIGKDDVDRGVPLTLFYPFMKDHDVITVELRRERFTQKVLPGQAGQPVIFILTRAMFESAGNSAAFAISFTVVDQLNNYTDRKRWSKMLRADVDVDRVFVDAPILREDPNDIADDPAIVDRDKLKGGPLLVVVLPEAPAFEVGDRVEGRFTSTPSGVDIPFSGTIDKDGFGRFNPCIMEIPNSNIVLDDQVRAAFTLSRNGVTVGGSRTAVARVIGAGAITLNPPTLVLPATSPIDVLAYANGVTVRVTFAGNSGDKAQLKELNPAPGAVPFPEQDFIAGQSDFTLSPAFLAARQGQDVELTWVLIRGGIAFDESLALLLKIDRIADGDTRLPMPVINGNTTDELDTTQLPANAQLTVAPWLNVPGECLWLDYEGVDQSGAIVVLPDLTGSPHTTPPGLSRLAPVEWLKALKNGTRCMIKFSVNFDKVPNKTTAVKFPITVYDIKSGSGFEFDDSPMSFTQSNIHFPGLVIKSNAPNKFAQTRSPTSGQIPFTYQSGNTNVAQVEKIFEGVRVIAIGNGDTTVTVRDARGETKQFSVSVRNVRTVLVKDGPINNTQAMAWKASVGGGFYINSDGILVAEKYQSKGETLLLVCRPYDWEWPHTPGSNHCVSAVIFLGFGVAPNYAAADPNFQNEGNFEGACCFAPT